MYPYGALTSCKKIEKTCERSREIRTDGQMDGEATDRQTDKGDYYGPHRLDLGSKIEKTNRHSLRYLKTDHRQTTDGPTDKGDY